MSTDQRLPKWASVAFSARCAEHLLPILDSVWPNRDESNDAMFSGALNAARTSAANGKLVSDYPDVDVAITSLAGQITLTKRGLMESIGLPINSDHWSLVENIATVFAKTSETAHAQPNQAHEIAVEGFAWAQEVAASDTALINRMHEEFASLRQESLNWRHNTAVEWDGSAWLGKTPVPWWKIWATNGG